MTVYSIVYIVLAAILLVYSILNRLDLLCVAAVCYIVYSIYCIPGIGRSGFYRPKLSPQLYTAVYIQLAILLVFLIFSRILMKRRSRVPSETVAKTPRPADSSRVRDAFRIYTVVIALFALVNIVSVGLKGFMEGKSTVWEQTNVFYVISLYGAWPSFAYGIHKNDKWVWIPSLLIELTIFFAGSRAFTATLIVIFLCEKGTSLWKKRKGNLKIYILGALGILFLLMYRMIDEQIMAGDIGGAMQTLQDPKTWMTALEFNEPRVIIANYDYSFTSGLRLPPGDIIYRIIDFVPGLTALARIDLVYPEYYSTWLTEEVKASAGVGGTIWGESYVMFGFFGIILFTLIWLFFIKLCNHHLDYHTNHGYFIVSIGTYFAWYINRLDFNRVAQACKVMLFCYLIWAAVYLLLGGVFRIAKARIQLK